MPPPPARVCELVPAFVIPKVGTVQLNKVEDLEEYLVMEYVYTWIVVCSLKRSVTTVAIETIRTDHALASLASPSLPKSTCSPFLMPPDPNPSTQ